MESELKPRMNDDLGRTLDRLCMMKLQPALYLSQKMDSVINNIDLDAERILLALGEDSANAESQLEAAAKVNEARCEFVRILKALEQGLQARLTTGGTKKLDKGFLDLQERVKEFQSTPFSSEDDINDLEDSYVQLIVDINDMTNDAESKIFGNQTIFYLNSRRPSELGSLFHLADVYLTNEQIDCLR